MEMIQEGELPPGSRLPEVALCKHFGVSRTPLREALKILAADGWLVWKANYGVWVSDVDVGDVRDVFEVLSGLEVVIGTMLVDRITDEEIQVVDDMHEKLTAYHSQADRINYFKQNQEIHVYLAKICRNRALADTYGALSKKIYRARTIANYGRGRWDESLSEHSSFMTSLRLRDGTELARKLKEHNEATCEAVLASLATRLKEKKKVK